MPIAHFKPSHCFRALTTVAAYSGIASCKLAPRNVEFAVSSIASAFASQRARRQDTGMSRLKRRRVIGVKRRGKQQTASCVAHRFVLPRLLFDGDDSVAAAAAVVGTASALTAAAAALFCPARGDRGDFAAAGTAGDRGDSAGDTDAADPDAATAAAAIDRGSDSGRGSSGETEDEAAAGGGMGRAGFGKMDPVFVLSAVETAGLMVRLRAEPLAENGWVSDSEGCVSWAMLPALPASESNEMGGRPSIDGVGPRPNSDMLGDCRVNALVGDGACLLVGRLGTTLRLR